MNQIRAKSTKPRLAGVIFLFGAVTIVIGCARVQKTSFADFFSDNPLKKAGSKVVNLVRPGSKKDSAAKSEADKEQLAAKDEEQSDSDDEDATSGRPKKGVRIVSLIGAEKDREDESSDAQESAMARDPFLSPSERASADKRSTEKDFLTKNLQPSERGTNPFHRLQETRKTSSTRDDGDSKAAESSEAKVAVSDASSKADDSFWAENTKPQSPKAERVREKEESDNSPAFADTFNSQMDRLRDEMNESNRRKVAVATPEPDFDANFEPPAKSESPAESQPQMTQEELPEFTKFANSTREPQPETEFVPPPQESEPAPAAPVLKAPALAAAEPQVAGPTMTVPTKSTPSATTEPAWDSTETTVSSPAQVELPAPTPAAIPLPTPAAPAAPTQTVRPSTAPGKPSPYITPRRPVQRSVYPVAGLADVVAPQVEQSTTPVTVSAPPQAAARPVETRTTEPSKVNEFRAKDEFAAKATPGAPQQSGEAKAVRIPAEFVQAASAVPNTERAKPATFVPLQSEVKTAPVESRIVVSPPSSVSSDMIVSTSQVRNRTGSRRSRAVKKETAEPTEEASPAATPETKSATNSSTSDLVTSSQSNATSVASVVAVANSDASSTAPASPASSSSQPAKTGESETEAGVNTAGFSEGSSSVILADVQTVGPLATATLDATEPNVESETASGQAENKSMKWPPIVLGIAVAGVLVLFASRRFRQGL